MFKIKWKEEKKKKLHFKNKMEVAQYGQRQTKITAHTKVAD